LWAGAGGGEVLVVVTVAVGAPTYVVDLAAALMQLINTGRPGIYHLVNSGECSRHAFAQEIVRLIGLDVPIEPIHLADFVRPSSPPPYAPLANVFGAAAGVEMRPWQEALADFVAQYEAQ
jgi:dTDP-4-dehydrorhamnose reductase